MRAFPPHTYWLFADKWQEPWQGRWRTFRDEQSFSAWAEWAAGYVFWAGPARGPVRTFYRCGNLPPRWVSYNYRDDHPEGGVSVYPSPEPFSFAGMCERDWYRGPGVQVGVGSDGEPLIIPVGKWRRFARR